MTWFRFPLGVTEISVQNQNFRTEARDAEGRSYFRAPEHFTPLIVDLPGFYRTEAPEGAPEDLAPTLNGAVGGEVSALSGQLEVKDIEISHLKASLAETLVERDDLKLKIQSLTAELQDSKDDLEAMGKVVEDLRGKPEAKPEAKGKDEPKAKY